MAVNPSRRQPGHKGHGVEYSLAHPVDSVSWSEAERFGRRLGVRLPHGDELEYAGRAGATGSAHFAGREAAQLRGLENLRDRAYGRLLRRQDVLPWDDAWPQASPVGTFAPNGFGLHDVGGNLTEWCATYYGPEDRPGAPDEPGTPEPFRLRQQRGANWGLPLEQVRASYVMFQRPDYSAHWCGVRLARDWQQP
jgi:formylglycine-generating enzyme required for sulfatase activity